VSRDVRRPNPEEEDLVTVHPSVAFAAFAAGLVVGGGAYAASHDLGIGDGLSASAGARARLSEQIPAGRPGRRGHLLDWHAPRVPHLKPPRPAAPLVQVSAPAVSTAPAAAPVTSTSPAPPVTRTSPTGGDDEGGQDD
jgi:hypothetical protein